MKSTNPARPVVSTREMLALTTLLAVGHAAAAEAPAKPEEKKDKKKDGESQTLSEIVIEAVRQSLYKPERLTSQKYTVPIRDVPQTVTVVPKEVIQEQGAQTLTDVLRNVPGISIQAGEGGGASSTAGDMFTMRGFNASNSIFVDGVRDDGLISRDTFNLEAVEAYLGPTGSDVGRGTASGYVNMATKTPKNENFYAGSVGYGSGNRTRTTIDLNQDLGFGPEGSWTQGTAFRLNGLYQEGGVPGRDIVERNSWAIAPSVAFGLGTDTRVFLSTQHVRQDNIPDYGLPSRMGYPLAGVSDEWFYGSVSDFEDISQDSYTARIEHDINENITITNQTRYSESDRLAVVSGLGYNVPTTTPATPIGSGNVTRSRQGNERHNKIFSNQTTVRATFNTGELKHSLVGALEYTWDEQYSPNVIGVGTNPTPLPPPWVPNPYIPIPMHVVNHPTFFSRGSTDTLGISLFDTIEIGKHWQVSAGVRTDTYKTRFTQVSANPTVHETADDTLFSGKIGLTYKPVEEGSIYLAYGTSQTPPGTANFTLSTSATNQNNPNLDPQESENIELGVKWDFFKSALTVTGAVFHTENTNVIYLSDPVNQTYSADGGQEVNGVTIGAAGKITENWGVFANLTLMDAQLDQKGNVNNGKDLTLTPELSGSLWTTYKLPYNFTVGGGMRYQESVFVNAGNTIKVPSYAVFDAMVQYDINEDINVRANVYNLLDREYRASINNNGQRYNAGAPLSFMLSTNFKF